MKTKEQKQKELQKGKDFLSESSILLFADITKVSAPEVRKLRAELLKLNSKLLVIKKRLLGLLLKEKGIAFDPKQTKTSLGTVFSEADPEKVAGVLFRFFKDRKEEKEKIVGGYDLKKKKLMTAENVLFLGQLPPREVLLAQLLSQLASPIRSLLYLMQERARSMDSHSSASVAVSQK